MRAVSIKRLALECLPRLPRKPEIGLGRRFASFFYKRSKFVHYMAALMYMTADGACGVLENAMPRSCDDDR
jgi:hypothetical protein